MKQHIGEIIADLREKSGCTQMQLSLKVCSVAEAARIESGQKIPNQFLLDILFGRMGRSTDRLEYILPFSVYQMYELQFQIQREILYRNLEEAGRLLDKYEKKKVPYQPLHIQFYEQERAQIEWIRGGNTEVILLHLDRAVIQTMEQEQKIEKGIFLSADEIKLLLFRWEVCFGTECERSVLELVRITEYLESREFDTEELAKVYPYVVVLGSHAGIFMGKELKKRAEKAFELLRDSGQILFLPQILEILSGCSQSEQEKKEYGFLRESILEVGEKYGVHYEKMPLFRYCNRMFELDYEVIKRTRDAMDLSQESLCDDICTQETLSRIERGKNAPAFGTMQQLMKKMDRKWQQIAMVITAERYEALVVEREVVKRESRREEKCQEEFEKLGELLDMDVLENQQYVELKRLMFEMRNQKYSYEEAIQKLYDILYLTLKCRGDEMYQYPLMFREVLVLNLVAVYHCWNQEVDKGVQIWQKLLKNFEQKKVDKVFLSREWELIAGNMAQRIAELGKEEQGIRICQERLKMQLEMGKGAHIGRSLEIMAYALDKLQNQNYLYYFRNAMHWFRLMKHDSRYLLMKEYAEENQLELYS